MKTTVHLFMYWNVRHDSSVTFTLIKLFFRLNNKTISTYWSWDRVNFGLFMLHSRVLLPLCGRWVISPYLPKVLSTHCLIMVVNFISRFFSFFCSFSFFLVLLPDWSFVDRYQRRQLWRSFHVESVPHSTKTQKNYVIIYHRSKPDEKK